MDHGSKVKVWDFPTRLFHWLLVILIGFSWWSAENGKLDWHGLSGLGVLALLVFRLVWGFIGGSTARFSQFVRSPFAALTYLRSDNSLPKRVGHNPIGGYSVLLMLGLVSFQVLSGLFADDEDMLDPGPLNRLVEYDQGVLASQLHHLSFNAVQLVIAVHIVAILFYLFIRKRNLVTPMVTGTDTQLESEQGALVPSSTMRFIVAAAIGAGVAWTASKGFFIS